MLTTYNSLITATLSFIPRLGTVTFILFNLMSNRCIYVAMATKTDFHHTVLTKNSRVCVTQRDFLSKEP